MRIRDLLIEERMRLYNEAWKIRKELGVGFVRTANKLGIPRDAVRHWFHHGRNPYNEVFRNKFEEKPSSELSYVIGVVMGDGNLSIKRRGNSTQRQIRLRVNHKEFAERFSVIISKLLGKRKDYKIGKDGRQYVVHAASHQLYDFLKRPFEEFKPFIEKFPAEFIQGFVDSEGSIIATVCKAKGRMWLQSYISITNTNLEFLIYTKELLTKHFGIESKIKASHKKGSSFLSPKGKIFKRTKDAFDLRIYGIHNIKLFNQRIGFTILEKRQKVCDIINIFNCWKPLERRGVWLNTYAKYNNRWVRKNLSKITLSAIKADVGGDDLAS